MEFPVWSWEFHIVSLLFNRHKAKGGLKSESGGGFSIAIINIPFYYPKLLHPLHGIDKMSILKKFTFTCLIYLQVHEVGFRSTANNLIC